MEAPLTWLALSRRNPAMLRPFGAAHVVMSWRGNRAAIELKIDRRKIARTPLMAMLAPSAS
jgi:hypothetical protein